MSGGLSLMLDGLIVLLLAATIGYAFVLNRKLAALRTSRAELERLIGALSGACEKSERNLAALREAAEDVGRPLQGRVDEAKGTRDDLALLVERAEAAADRLERGIDHSRKASRSSPVRAAVPAAEAEPGPAKRRSSPAHAALIKALQGVR